MIAITCTPRQARPGAWARRHRQRPALLRARRHGQVDLPLAPDASLSLRHELFVVRLVRGRVRFWCSTSPARPAPRRSSARCRWSTDRPCCCAPRAVMECSACRPVRRRRSRATRRSVATGSRRGRARRAFNWTFTPRARGAIERHLPQPLRLTLDRGALDRGVLLGRDRRCDASSSTTRSPRACTRSSSTSTACRTSSTRAAPTAWSTRAGGACGCQPLRDGQRPPWATRSSPREG